MSTLRDELLALIAGHRGLTLAEARAQIRPLGEMPDEVFLMAEELAGAQAGLPERLKAFSFVTRQVVKMAEGGSDEELVAMLRASKARQSGPAELERVDPALAAVRADVELARLAKQIELSEGLDYGAALRLAGERSPEVARRYQDEVCGGSRPTQPSRRPAPRVERPDVVLAERASARAEQDEVTYREAIDLVLAEDPALARRYGETASSPASAAVRPPRGMRLVTMRADVELAERVEARCERGELDRAAAMRLVLAEDAALASRYEDFTQGRTALEEATRRALQVRTASRGRLSREKAFNAVLAEDPALRAGVGAYFEKID